MKRTIFIGLVMLVCYGLLAVPAAPFLTTYTQEDGSTLEIYVRGDERLNWTETSDGYTLLTKNKSKYYAVKDRDGDLVVSDILANDPANRSAEEVDFLRSIPKKLAYSRAQINIAKEIRTNRLGGFPTSGENNMILILANFADTNPTYSQANFINMMNQNNYSGIGSFKQYYLEVSYGQLTVNTTVVGWVDVPHNHDYYGPQDRWSEFARDAVEAADPLVDYSQFDNDGDGRVDGVAIYHQGRGQETTGDTSDIWSHSFSLTSAGYYLNLDGVQIADYTMQAEKQYWSMAGIGVIAHEFGHNLGTPDFYDTDYQVGGNQDGTGEWDIMGSGAYNGGGDRPAHHNMWTKKYFGWVQPQELYFDASVTVASSTTYPVAYYFTTPVNGEYMLMENVQQTGFNASVPGNGLLICHVDENWIMSHLNQNNLNATSHQGFYVVAASGGTNSSTATFPSYTATSFTDTSFPAIPSWGNYDVSKGLTGITKTGGVVNFSFFDDSAYTPQVTFTNLMNNQYFNIGDEINLDLEIAMSIEEMNIDMVEIFVNGTTQQVHLSQPYNYSLIPTSEHFGQNEVMVRVYTNFQTYDTYYYFNVRDGQERFLDQFEDYEDFSLNVGEWQNLDNDNQETISLLNYDYPNQTDPKAFMIFNPNTTFPYIREIDAYSGNKMAVAFTNSTEVANDDWMISPEINLSVVLPEEEESQMVLNLNVLGTGEEGELFNVLYSESYPDYEDFIALNDSPLEAGPEWTQLSYNLPAGAMVKVAIQVLSTGGSFVMVDDISLIEVFPVSNNENDIADLTPLKTYNYPNPFNPETTISFAMSEAGNAKVQVFNLRGQLVNTLLNDQVAAGNHSVVWNGKDYNNKDVASGIYFYRIKTSKATVQRKMILQK
jgi:M6 family metalloprotease-like protein